MVYVADEERYDGVLARRTTEYAYTLDLRQALHGVLRQFAFVPLDVVHAYRGHVVDGLGKSGGGHIVGRTSLELERKMLEHGLLEAHALNHLSPALVRRQAV